jgi:hypothetical protein
VGLILQAFEQTPARPVDRKKGAPAGGPTFRLSIWLPGAGPYDFARLSIKRKG